MAIQNQEKVMENLRKQLSVAVRSVQWSYAIFWSLSATQQGVLEWGEGYYNGDIMTRKTVAASEAYADKLGLQRSQQLRELYESLLKGESEVGSKRPSATLSPEDLSDLEWYYLVCMSFVFEVGQSLPGRAFASGQSVWLCNAQEADSRLFSRSLLAKSASVKTIICFPHWRGVIELGVTDLVSEDPNLIQQIKTSLLEFTKPTCFEMSSDEHNADDDKDSIGAKIHDMKQEMLEAEAFEKLYLATEEIKFQEEMLIELHRSMSEEFNNIDSLDDSSNDCCCGNNDQIEESMLEAGNDLEANSPVQNWHHGDEDDLSNCIEDSFFSSAYVSQDFSCQEKTMSSSRDKCTDKHLHLEELQGCNHTNFRSLELGDNDDGDEDLHYKRALAVILQSSHQSVRGRSLYICGHNSSSFVPWKKEFAAYCFAPQSPQRALKKMLTMVPLMIAKNSHKLLKKNEKEVSPSKPHADSRCTQGFSDKGRENKNHLFVRSMVPSINTIDKTSILNETIDYLKKLEARVEELESCINLSDSETKARRKYVDLIEQTSDNYHNKSRGVGNKMWLNKRKACDISESEAEPELCKVTPVDDNMIMDVMVTIREQEVMIDIRCPWRDYLLLDIMDTVNNLSLDAHTVHSSTMDGMLSVTLKSKFRGAAFTSAGMIKQAIRRTLGIC